MVNTKANLSARDGVSCTLLHYAAEPDHSAVSRILLDNKSDVNTTDTHLKTPLHFAAEGGHCTSIQLLLESHIYLQRSLQDDIISVRGDARP